VLGLLGVLWLPVVIGCLVALAAASFLFVPAPARLPRTAPHVPWGLLAVAIPLAALALAVTFWAPQPLDDSIRYHIVNAAHILNAGSIRSLPFAQAGDGSAASPGNGSLLLLLVLLPFHNAGLSGAVNLLPAGLIVVLTAVLLRELGRSAWLGALAGLVVVSTWGFFGWQIGSAYDDAVGLLGLLAGITFGLRAARTGELRWLLLSGLGLGLAIGTKDISILPALAVAVAVLCLDRAWHHPRKVAILLVSMLSISIVWYLRNWVDAGDPLFPETVRLGSTVVFPGLGGGANTGPGVQQSVLGWLLSGRGLSASRWLGVAVDELGLTLVALVMSFPLAVLARGRERLVPLLSLACTIAFLVTPFTGSTEYAQVVGAVRYLLPAAAFGVVAVLAFLPRRWITLAAAAALAINCVALITELGVLAIAVLGVTGALALPLLMAPRPRRTLASLAASPAARAIAVTCAVLFAVAGAVNLQPSDELTPVQQALQAAGDPRAPVVVMDVTDVQAILGANLNVDLVGAGYGPVGAEQPIRDASALTVRIESLHPAAVVVGSHGSFDVVPKDWSPPTTWRYLGMQGGAAVYQPAGDMA
jgi:hypothetical protein